MIALFTGKPAFEPMAKNPTILIVTISWWVLVGILYISQRVNDIHYNHIADNSKLTKYIYMTCSLYHCMIFELTAYTVGKVKGHPKNMFYAQRFTYLLTSKFCYLKHRFI